MRGTVLVLQDTEALQDVADPSILPANVLTQPDPDLHRHLEKRMDARLKRRTQSPDIFEDANSGARPRPLLTRLVV